jgi:hypothetical protein
MGTGFETALPQMAEAFKRALEAADSAPPGVKDCPILIENAAGTGGTVGRSLDEIAALIDAAGGDERIGLCIDTQHLWASGIDYSTTHGTNKLVHDIDMRIGLGRLRCFHLNDSKIELGGNRDRHANIDEGTIGTMGLATLVGHPDFRDLPLLLEVPGTGEGPRWEDVIAARKVVVEGIKLYDGEVSARSDCSRYASGGNEATREEEAGEEGRCEEGRCEEGRCEEGRCEEDSGQESACQEISREEVTGKEDCREEEAGEDTRESCCEQGTGQENPPEKVSRQKIIGEEDAGEEGTDQAGTGKEDRREKVTSQQGAGQEDRQEEVERPQ